MSAQIQAGFHPARLAAVLTVGLAACAALGGCSDDGHTPARTPSTTASAEIVNGVNSAFDRLIAISQTRDANAYADILCSSANHIDEPQPSRATFSPISVVSRGDPEVTGASSGTLTAVVRTGLSEPARALFDFVLENGQWRYCPTAELVRIN